MCGCRAPSAGRPRSASGWTRSRADKRARSKRRRHCLKTLQISVNAESLLYQIKNTIAKLTLAPQLPTCVWVRENIWSPRRHLCSGLGAPLTKNPEKNYQFFVDLKIVEPNVAALPVEQACTRAKPESVSGYWPRSERGRETLRRPGNAHGSFSGNSMSA